MIALVPEIRIFEWQIKIRGSPDKTIVEPLLKSIRDGVTVQLEELTLYIGPGLRYIEPNLVSSAVLKVEDCTIFGLSRSQLLAILDGVIHNTNTTLRFLKYGGCWETQNVAPNILAEAAMKLESLEVFYLHTIQLYAIFTWLAATPDSRLKNLRFCGPGNVRQMDPEVVKTALAKLESVGPLWT